MKFHGIQLEEGSSVKNMTVEAGTAFPSMANDGELFFRSDADESVKGMYVYIEGHWHRIGFNGQTGDVVTVTNSATSPIASPKTGDMQFNQVAQALEVYNGTDWISCAMEPIDPDPVAMALIFGN